MAGRAARISGAVLVGLVSLGAAIVSGVLQQQRLLLLASEVAAQLAPIPAGMIPAGAAVPPPSAPLTPAQYRVVRSAMWRDPFDDQIFNLVYTDALRTGAAAGNVGRDADLLAGLGWRFTPAQQNLIIRAALYGDYARVADRADALLRRQKLPALGYAMFQAMETLPEMHGYVAGKLAAGPPWRRDYLSVAMSQGAPALLIQRIRTLGALLKAPGGLSREEIAPSLAALVSSGHGREAYELWAQQVGRSSREANLVYDPHFQRAAELADAPDAAIPFEWRFGQGVGYSAQPSSMGADVDWDRHGVPVFLSQSVPVEPGHRYALTIRGSAGTGAALASLLAPAIDCGTQSLRPDRAEPGEGRVRFVFPALPATCDMGSLTISGAVDAGSGNASFSIVDVDLRRTT